VKVLKMFGVFLFIILFSEISYADDEGRMVCLKCIAEDHEKLESSGEKGDQALDPLFGGKGRSACIYHGELNSSQMKFVVYKDEAERIKDLRHLDE